MGHDRQRAEKLQPWRKAPAFAKQKEITPKAPGRRLRCNEQCIVGFKAESVTKHSRKRRISREKRDIRHFHYLMVNRRNNRFIPAVDDVHKPIAVVLNQRGIAVGEWPFRRQKTHRDCDLRQGQKQSCQQRFNSRSCAFHRRGSINASTRSGVSGIRFTRGENSPKRRAYSRADSGS